LILIFMIYGRSGRGKYLVRSPTFSEVRSPRVSEVRSPSLSEVRSRSLGVRRIATTSTPPTQTVTSIGLPP
ncbi:MAG: hypothetical protein P5700_25725, partial [Arthrospira platensis PCC 7345]|nr:hypothetical protein [Arthrospira platensis PCC 7345]